MKPVWHIAQMHLRTKLNWFYIPFAIVILSFLINWTIGSLISSAEGIKTGGIAAIYVYMLVMGMVIIKDTFPFSISFGVRRADYFMGTLLHIILVSAISALILNLFTFLERITNHWGVNLYFFDIPYLNDGALWQQWIIAFCLFLYLFYNGFFIASVTRRFGIRGLILLFLIVAVLYSLFHVWISISDGWLRIFEWFIQHTAFDIALWLIPPTLFYILLSYLFIKRATV